MLKIVQKQLAIELTEEDAAHVQQSLQTRYNSLLYRVRIEYLNRLGLDLDSYKLTAPPADSKLLVGELCMPEPGTVFYIKSVRGEKLLKAGVISTDSARDSEEYFNEIRDVVREVREDVAPWTLAEGHLPLHVEDAAVDNEAVSAEQITAAKAIMDKESRNLLEKIREAGSIFLNKIETNDRQDTENRIHAFKELHLLNMDYAVLCRRTGQQILRVADKATLDESSQKAFKCFICGSQLSDEVIEEVLACTDACNDLLKDQNWILVLVRGILAELGIHHESLQIYRGNNLPLQIFLSLNGLRYLFVLCTKPLDLDQACLISAHLTAYHLDNAVIISTERISSIMRHHLVNTNSATAFHFIDDLTNLDDKLQRTLIDQQRAYLGAQLADISDMTPVDVSGLVLHRMIPAPAAPVVEAPVVETSAPEVAAPVVEAPVVEVPVVEAAPEVVTPAEEAVVAKELPVLEIKEETKDEAKEESKEEPEKHKESKGKKRR